jgi:hypothetical protein
MNPSRIPPDTSVASPFAQYSPQEEAKRRTEAKLVTAICKVFDLNISAVRRASFASSGEQGLTMHGLNKYLVNPLPLKFDVYVPRSGKGNAITVASLLRNPERIPMIDHFLQTAARSPEIILRRIIIGSHPRLISYLAITDYPVQTEGLSCFSFNVLSPSDQQMKRLTLGTLENILQAYKFESGWSPT